MYQSQLFHSTLRDVPAEAEVISHQLLLRGGYIRPVAAGVYTYTVLGNRVLKKIEHIIRAEMDQAGAQEVLLPVLQPIDLWKESGRINNYGPELMTLEDRHERQFALGPTHEEVITTLVKQEISSYRKLPVTLYQIQTKFRDERRPRFGLMRGREFLMKDAYSFDTSWEGLDESYQAMKQAYNKIFTQLNINYRAVEADGGTIGGEGGTHEFMALASVGEDTIATCTHCQYAANLEKAEVKLHTLAELNDKELNYKKERQGEQPQKVLTPDVKSIDQLCQFFNVSASQILKTIIFLADGKPVAVVVSGQYEVNELKVKNYLAADHVELISDEQFSEKVHSVLGFVGPMGINIPILYDYSVSNVNAGIVGANEKDYHFVGINSRVHLPLGEFGDFRNVVEHDDCPRCEEGKLKFYRGIEMGHIFKLGTKYSVPLKATFLNKQGQTEPMIMGCYGIGVSRILSVLLEQQQKNDAIVWPNAVAPYSLHILLLNIKDEHQLGLLESLQTHCKAETLIDDRDERAGVKFKDADLIGSPYRIVIGKDAKEGKLEWHDRFEGTKELVTIEQAIHYLCQIK